VTLKNNEGILAPFSSNNKGIIKIKIHRPHGRTFAERSGGCETQALEDHSLHLWPSKMMVKHRWKHLVNLLAGGHLQNYSSLTSQATHHDNNNMKHERLSIRVGKHL